jgi:hypothetical protein
MKSGLLIDAIVRQTMVLLAQISTAAGIRAPLAHVADEVFVSLAREIEAQGVGRKVAADMFGLALRTYQKKVQRLAESATQREKTLWEAVLDFVAERTSATRGQVLERFGRDGEREVIGVLSDLVGSGLVHASGRGASAVPATGPSAADRTATDLVSDPFQRPSELHVRRRRGCSPRNSALFRHEAVGGVDRRQRKREL